MKVARFVYDVVWTALEPFSWPGDAVLWFAFVVSEGASEEQQLACIGAAIPISKALWWPRHVVWMAFFRTIPWWAPGLLRDPDEPGDRGGTPHV